MVNMVHTRLLQGASVNGIVLLDAVASIGADERQTVSLYFAADTPVEKIGLPTAAKLLAQGTIGGCLVLRLSYPESTPLRLEFAGSPVDVVTGTPEQAIMAGKNVLAATRNGEDVSTVLTWLAFHAEHHAASGAVILDRAPPSEGAVFDMALRDGLAKIDAPLDVFVLRSAQPLGKADLPDESHPFCAPGAPGKDRMTVPQPDPWKSPLAAAHCYEIMRERFLAQARAVANIDVFDLVLATPDGSVFDRAVRARSGAIPLLGTQAYPWRVRPDEPIRFADHICVQFDAAGPSRKWCIAPGKAAANAVWRPNRIGNVTLDDSAIGHFYRFMNLRHRAEAVSKIIPKSALIEDERLLHLSEVQFGHKPIRLPEISRKSPAEVQERCAIVTTMKNEGPFILEWLAYHRVIGFDSFLIYTNDCTDGTDSLCDLLQSKGYIQHRENPFRAMNLKPQHAALAAAGDEPIISEAKWATCIDVDEFINIKVGDGTLSALFAAVPDANLISMTWRLFGNADIAAFTDDLIIRNFTRCAPEFAPKPHQAWGFKTLFQNIGIFKKLGVHRPKGLNSQLVDNINWVNGSGVQLAEQMYRNAWRSTTDTYGYDLVQLNHYAVRSVESFLVKRDRGRVNHVDRDQGLAYWFRMNNNRTEDLSIQRMISLVEAELSRLMADPEIATAHHHAVQCHRDKIAELRQADRYGPFFEELNSIRMRRLSRLHGQFGANVFLQGPACVPDEILERDPEESFFFTVETGETQH